MTLSAQQEQIVLKTFKEWEDRVKSCPRLDKEKVESGFKWLYERSGLKPVPILYTSSPASALYAANLIYQEVVNKGKRFVKKAKVEHESSFEEAVGIAANFIGKSLEYTRELIPDKWSYFDFASHGTCADIGWTARWDAAKRAGLDVSEFRNLDTWLELMKGNAFDALQFDNCVIVVEYPEKLSYTVQSGNVAVPHCIDGPAYKFRDGYESFHINGVHIRDKEYFYRLVNKTASAREVLGQSNIQIRMVSLSLLGPDWAIKATNAKLIGTATRKGYSQIAEVAEYLNIDRQEYTMTYELYRLDDFPEEGEESYALKYGCPSTGETYFKFVPPEAGRTCDPIAAFVSTTPLTREEFENIDAEA